MSDNIKPTVQEKTAWAKVPQEFNDWWNGEYSDESNPFRFNSAAYWAWAGWSEAVRLNATVPDEMVLVPVDTLKHWRDALAKELSDWDNIDPLLHHVQTSHDEIEALLSAAPAAPQPAQQPLTDGQFQKIRRTLSQQSGWDGDGWDQALKEAIEQAHGIGVKT